MRRPMNSCGEAMRLAAMNSRGEAMRLAVMDSRGKAMRLAAMDSRGNAMRLAAMDSRGEAMRLAVMDSRVEAIRLANLCGCPKKMAKKYPRLCGDTYLILFSLSILPFRLSYSNHSGFSWLFGAFHGNAFFVPIGFQPFRFTMGF